MDVTVAPGTYLISVPQMLDPNFMHTVVLVIEHTEQGAYGLVVNRKLDVDVAALFPDHPQLSHSDFPVLDGGPVGRDTLQFLHRMPEDIPGGIEIVDGLFLGGDLDAMSDAVVGLDRSVRDLRMFVGYSGWGEGQLDGELAVASWVPSPANPSFVFEDDAREATWRKALRDLGAEGEKLSHLPPDVSWN